MRTGGRNEEKETEAKGKEREMTKKREYGRERNGEEETRNEGKGREVIKGRIGT